MSIAAIILASGTGLRFGDNQPKQFTKLAGLPILVHTLRVFECSPEIDKIIVVTNEEFVEHVWMLLGKHCIKKVQKVVCGGGTRQESSAIGLKCCDSDIQYVLIHDGVRPFISHQVLQRLVVAVKEYGAIDTVIPSADTLVEVDDDGFIRNIPDRSKFRRGQTPQAFAIELIREAHRRAFCEGIDNATDDCALVLRLGHKVFTVSGDEQNIKITYPLDLHLADKLFQLKVQSLPVVGGDISILHGKIFVVIGGTSGIGHALCTQLASFSDKVYPLSRSTSVPVDVRRMESIQRAFDTILIEEDRIDFVINCSGDLIRKDVEFTSWEEWQQIYDTNINGNFHLAKILVPLFKRQNGGSLMFVGSSSYTRGRGGYAAYSSSKAALVNFCQALSEEVADENILVNLVSPGRVRTPLRFINFGQEAPETLLEPEVVARVIVQALATPTTGSIFEVA